MEEEEEVEGKGTEPGMMVMPEKGTLTVHSDASSFAGASFPAPCVQFR